jgi:hypothetical protein
MQLTGTSERTVHRRRFLALAATVPLTGCGGLGEAEPSQLALTVQNQREQPITAQVTVLDSEGTTYEDETDQIDSNVARTFEVTVGPSGRHEGTVSGADWRGQLAWNADVCERFSGTVRVTSDAIEVASECDTPR